jgi:tellurite resistance protein
MTQKPSNEEEKFFQQQEVELRKQTEYEQERAALATREAAAVKRVLGISDDALAARLVELGFGEQTVGIFPLLPLVYVAWADGEVTEAERRRILEAARARGADAQGEGYQYLRLLLETRPREDFFETCVETLRAIFQNMPAEDAAEGRQDLISLSLSVANASGGFLGLFGDKVNDEEKAMLDELIRELGLSGGEGAAALLGRL